MLKKFVIITIVLMMIVCSLTFTSNAEEVKQEDYYLSWQDIKNESDLTKIFTYIMPDGEVSWNSESNRVKFTSTGTAAALIDIASSLPKEGAVNFTVEADMYLTENNYGNNALFQLGVFGTGKLAKGLYFQLYVRENKSDDYSIYDNNGTNSRNTISTPVDEEITPTTKVKVKIVVLEKTTEIFYNDKSVYTIRTSSLYSKSGNVFIFLRQNCTLEVENLNIYKTVAEEDTTQTTDTEVVQTTDSGTVSDTKEITDITESTLSIRPIEDDSDTNITESSDVQMEKGCSSSLFSVFLIPGICCVVALVILKKKEKRRT